MADGDRATKGAEPEAPQPLRQRAHRRHPGRAVVRPGCGAGGPRARGARRPRGVTRLQREALIGSALHGRSGTQLARQLGVTEPTVRQLVFRARGQLRRAMPACIAPPLAFLRLIRRAGATAGGAATAPARSLRGRCSKPPRSSSSALPRWAPAKRSTRAATARAPPPGTRGRRRQPARASRRRAARGRARGRPAPGGVTRCRYRRPHRSTATGHGSPAAPSAASMPRAPSAVAVAPVRAQAEHGGGLAASPAARVLRLDPAVGGVAETRPRPGPGDREDGGAARQLARRLGSPETLDAVARALAVTAQAATSAGQTLVDDVPAVVNATTQVAQAVLASAQSAAAALQGAQTVVTGMAAPALTGLEGVVVQSPGATGASGPPQVPGLDGVVQSLGATGVSEHCRSRAWTASFRASERPGSLEHCTSPGLDGVVQSPGPAGASGPPRVPGIGSARNPASNSCSARQDSPSVVRIGT